MKGLKGTIIKKSELGCVMEFISQKKFTSELTKHEYTKFMAEEIYDDMIRVSHDMGKPIIYSLPNIINHYHIANKGDKLPEDSRIVCEDGDKIVWEER